MNPRLDADYKRIQSGFSTSWKRTSGGRKRGKQQSKGEERNIKMAVKIRLARFGCRNRPFYRVLVADSRSCRDGKHLETLGYYNPLAGEDGGKRMRLKLERVKYWLSVGAQPSEPVQRILFRAGILAPPPPILAMKCKPGHHSTGSIDSMTGLCLNLVGSEAVEDPTKDGESEHGEGGGKQMKSCTSPEGLCLAYLFEE